MTLEPSLAEFGMIAIGEIIVTGDRIRQESGDLTELVNSIKIHGTLLQPILLNSGSNELVAGWLRLKAAEKTGLKEVPFVRYNGTDRLRAEYDENKCRKQFGLYDALAWYHKIAQTKKPGRPKKGGKLPLFTKGKSRELAGLGTFSGRTIADAVYVEKAAEMDPKFKPTYDKMLQDENVKEARRYVERIQKIDAIAKATANCKMPDSVTIYHGDFRDIAPTLPAESCKLAVVDLPWDNETVVEYADAATHAIRLLKSGGYFLVYASEIKWRETANLVVEAGFLDGPIIDIAYKGGKDASLYPYNTFVKDKHLMLFYKSFKPADQEWIPNRIEVTDCDKLWHEWQQSRQAIEKLISMLTQPGDQIIDLTMGTGTTAVAALKLGCRFIGIDRDSAMIEKAKTRIKQSLAE